MTDSWKTIKEDGQVKEIATTIRQITGRVFGMEGRKSKAGMTGGLISATCLRYVVRLKTERGDGHREGNRLVKLQETFGVEARARLK